MKFKIFISILND
uniref:BLTX598 n=1 Tax=Nephila pilipes TaxID=299642 RepID=A0A076KZZ6_NEPPI|nr:BLTX598 [Nephila pilipes]